MAEISSPISVLTPTKSGAKQFLFFVIWLVLGLLTIYAIYYFIFRAKYSWSKIKVNIAQTVLGLAEPEKATKILTEGVNSIIASPTALRQAVTFSKSTGIALEQVLVDNALSLAKQFGYVKIKATVTQETQPLTSSN